MSPYTLSLSRFLGAFREANHASQWSCVGIFLLSASLAYGAGPIASPTPPAPPQVPPVIRGDSATDLNGNRISDALEAALETEGALSLASAPPLVAVELIFKEPITQRQIDDFLRLGGQITYIYQAISYGWNGLIPQQNITLLPSAMGPTLAQVEAPQQLQPYMDRASQIGRVRPVWKPGFAGSQIGFSGDPNTTIAFVGYGVDATHTDLQGRCIYWKDYTDENEPTPVDYDGHDTAVAGVAVGTGAAAGADAGELRYTMTSSVSAGLHLVEPIALPAPSITMKTQAFWAGGTASLYQVNWSKGINPSQFGVTGHGSMGLSPQTVTTTFSPGFQSVYSSLLACVDRYGYIDPFGKLANVTILTTISSYPGVGDGHNKFRGVAPGCKWCAAKVYTKDLYASTNDFAAGLDDLVVHRADKNIKIINISHGLRSAYGLPGASGYIRDKINTVVKNGILVVAAAGNGAEGSDDVTTQMADPARAGSVLTVGAGNMENAVTIYSTYGFLNPRPSAGEDFKPDVLAPGGSLPYSAITSCESNTSDCNGPDMVPNDYAKVEGTSISAAFVSGCAALVIDAMQQHGLRWKSDSAEQPKYVKMLLCATASETNAKREASDGTLDPTLDRAAAGPNGFPPGKDRYEGYGLINPDAAVEAVSLTYAAGTTVTADLGGDATAKRVWARTINLRAGCDIDLFLDNPAGADFDLYLYSAAPSDTGTPVILKSSTLATAGAAESLHYAPTANMAALLVVKRVSGTGTFTVRSTQVGPPTALDVRADCAINGSTTITLKATDDGKPNPPGAISYTILSKPAQGRLELTNGTPISNVPAKLPSTTDKVVYRPAAGWTGQDSFTFCADDGGTAPTGGQSNTATATITIVKEITVEYQVMDSADDAFCSPSSTTQGLTDKWLGVGMHVAGMRFCGVKVPQGATINRASLQICANPNGLTAAVEGVIKGEAADNPSAFGTTSRIVAQLAVTTASKDWKWTQDKPWVANAWYESPDISAVIQEIVNRSGWTSDSALVLIYTVSQPSFGDERRFWAFDGNPWNAAKLVITYQPK
jgi:hypothetical protein